MLSTSARCWNRGLHAQKIGQTLNELGDGLAMTRQAVTNTVHSRRGQPVTTLRHGREKKRPAYLNPVPIHLIGETLDQEIRARQTLPRSGELKRQLEKRDE
jgi:hypothetical protein